MAGDRWQRAAPLKPSPCIEQDLSFGPGWITAIWYGVPYWVSLPICIQRKYCLCFLPLRETGKGSRPKEVKSLGVS